MGSNDAGSIADQLAAEVRRLLQRADEQAKQVMEKAEAEVSRIRAEAEKEGHRRIEQARKALDDLEGRLGPTSPAAGSPAAEEPAVPDPVPEPAPAAKAAPAPAAGEGGDESAARLVAMKLALDGTSRDEVRARVEADYSVADLDRLIDDVFAKAKR